MTIQEIAEKSKIKMDIAESLYWHCLWLRDAPSDANVMWARLLNDKKYRLFGVKR